MRATRNVKARCLVHVSALNPGMNTAARHILSLFAYTGLIFDISSLQVVRKVLCPQPRSQAVNTSQVCQPLAGREARGTRHMSSVGNVFAATGI